LIFTYADVESESYGVKFNNKIVAIASYLQKRKG
jgi:hypothetical protein